MSDEVLGGKAMRSTGGGARSKFECVARDDVQGSDLSYEHDNLQPIEHGFTYNNSITIVNGLIQ